MHANKQLLIVRIGP